MEAVTPNVTSPTIQDTNFDFTVRTSIPVSITLCLFKGDNYVTQLNSKSFDRSTKFSVTIPGDIDKIKAYVGSKLGETWEDAPFSEERSLEVKDRGYGDYGIYSHKFNLHYMHNQTLSYK